MNHIKRGHYLSKKKRYTRRVHGSPYINCVRGTRTQPLICVGCYVPYWMSCAINKGGYFEIAFSSSSTHIIFASLWSACLRFVKLWRANSRVVSCVLGVHLSKVCWGLIPYSVVVKRSSFKKFAESSQSVHRSVFAELSKAFTFQKFAVKFYFGLSLHIFQHGLRRHCLWKMCAIPGACIKPGLVRLPLCHKVNLLSCVARQQLSGQRVNLPSCVAQRPLCHKVNLPSCVARQPLCHKVWTRPRCEARRRHVIMTCDNFSTRQTNTLTLCYLLGKTCKPAQNSATLESLKSTHSTRRFDRVSAKFEFMCESF